ncbi:unnamed protein product [Rhizoctonia solani]|uniref:Uncharacterized protein n=1 Tax=Rhizoctonia solani TaxID=456999 RepID=A0A8H2XU46_9AGAM|nr:unnamed protein product [Rhizoctonia solani]
MQLRDNVQTLRSIPLPVDATQTMREEHFSLVLHEYHSQLVSYFFMPPPLPICSHVGAQLKKSKTTIWAICLGAKLFKSLSENPHSTMALRYIGWLDKLEEDLDFIFNNSPQQINAAGRLLTQLEIVFLKFMSIGIISGYIVLQKALPGFLSMIAADSDSCTEHPGGSLVVSFAHTFGAPRYEIKRFVMYDIATSLVLGVPPLVEYGYDSECDLISYGLGQLHRIPAPLVEIISQVNSWRGGSRVTPLDDWRNLERRVLAWQPRPIVSETEGSNTGKTGRLAIHEGWRHVTLIYIYMGMCGVSSHDPRVQSSIARIVKLGEAVANLPVGVHMFVHFLIVGIGARCEQHRSIVRKKLASFKGSHIWTFRGPKFAQILEHLWQSAGAGGAPVTWEDYVRSRCIVAPL